MAENSDTGNLLIQTSVFTAVIPESVFGLFDSSQRYQLSCSVKLRVVSASMNRKSTSPFSAVKVGKSITTTRNEQHPTSCGMNERKCQKACVVVLTSERLLCLSRGVLLRKRKLAVSTLCDADGRPHSGAFVLILTASRPPRRKTPGSSNTQSLSHRWLGQETLMTNILLQEPKIGTGLCQHSTSLHQDPLSFCKCDQT